MHPRYGIVARRAKFARIETHTPSPSPIDSEPFGISTATKETMVMGTTIR